MSKSFGDRVFCWYVAVDHPDMDRFPQAKRRLAEGASLPLVLIDGEVRYSGVFSPTFIHMDLDRLIESADRRSQERPTASSARAVSSYMGSSPMGQTHVTRRTRVTRSGAGKASKR